MKFDLSQATASIAASSAAFEAINSKWGLCCLKCDQQMFTALEGEMNWTYDYYLFPGKTYPQDWANEKKMEFVPMITAQNVPLNPNFSKHCSMLPASNPSNFPACTQEMLQGALEYNDYLEDVTHLIGFNEPYAHVTSQQTATMTAQYYMPLAKHYGWKFVSPTVNHKYIPFFADFMKECLSMANDAEFPCDYTMIDVIAIHDYSTCVGSAAFDLFQNPGGSFQESFISLMGDTGGIDWSDWIYSTPFWMTETNCNHLPWGISNVDACLAITGQNPSHYGEGGMNAYNQMDQFERMAWWSVSGTILSAEGSNLLDPNNTSLILPCGRAHINGFGTDTDCTSAPTGDYSDESDDE